MIRMMIDEWGIEKMNQLMKVMKSGKNLDDALTEVYGFDRQGLDDQWRDSVGAPRYVPPNVDELKPTPDPENGCAAIQPDTPGRCGGDWLPIR